MATGFSVRQGGRTSFAPDAPEALQTTTGASGESRGAQAVGGESIGGVEGGSYSQPGYVADDLGEFFGRYLAPEIERKQQAQFFKGLTEAQSGRALEDLTNNGSPLTKMFGPSGFAQGAQYYHGQTAINQWQQDQLADMDNLRKLSPDELSKHFSESIQEHLTGDPYADQLVQAGYMEALAPLTQTHAKSRYGWMQSEARRGASEAGNSAAKSLQQIAQANFQLGEKGDNEAVRMAAQRFAGTMAKPEGMADETYREFLYDFMRNSMATGSFYGVEIMRSQGVMQLFDDDQQRKLEDDYKRYGDKALEAAVSDPAMVQELLTLEARIEQVKMGGDEAVTANEMVKLYQGFNLRLRQQTGVDQDYFDVDDVLSKGGEIFSAFTSRFLRNESRQQALEDRQWSADQRAAERQAEADADADAAQTAWATGQINAFLSTGGSSANLETVAFNEYSQGNYGNIASAFTKSSFVSQRVKSQVAATARAGIGTEYTEATKQAYNLWKSFNDTNPDLAYAYFGEYDAGFEVFDQLQGSGAQVAYREAFGSGRAPSGRLYGDKARQFNEEFEDLIEDRSGGIMPWNWNNHTLNPQGAAALRNLLYDNAAGRAATSTRPTRTLVRQGYQQAVREGRFEQYGVFGWSNGKGTKPLGKMLGLQEGDAHAVIQARIAKQLQRVGVDDLDSVGVIRTANRLVITYDDDEGSTKTAVLSLADLQATAQTYIKNKRKRASTLYERHRAAPLSGPKL